MVVASAHCNDVSYDNDSVILITTQTCILQPTKTNPGRDSNCLNSNVTFIYYNCIIREVTVRLRIRAGLRSRCL